MVLRDVGVGDGEEDPLPARVRESGSREQGGCL